MGLLPTMEEARFTLNSSINGRSQCHNFFQKEEFGLTFPSTEAVSLIMTSSNNGRCRSRYQRRLAIFLCLNRIRDKDTYKDKKLSDNTKENPDDDE